MWNIAGGIFYISPQPTEVRSETMSDDLVGYWDVPLSDGVHRVEFEHGTISGRRLVRVDGEEVVNKGWMFKLVGDEVFMLGAARCVVKVEPVGGFSYSYALQVNGKSYKKFTETQIRVLRTWIVNIGEETFRVVLEKGTLDIWANGKRIQATGEFVEDGTETHFLLGETPACIKAVTSGNRREGIIHHLIVDGVVVTESSTGTVEN